MTYKTDNASLLNQDKFDLQHQNSQAMPNFNLITDKWKSLLGGEQPLHNFTKQFSQIISYIYRLTLIYRNNLKNNIIRIINVEKSKEI